MPKKSRVIIGKAITRAIPDPAGGIKLETFIPWRLVRRNVKREIITPLDAPEQFRVEAGIERRERKAAEETPLVRALGLAYFWRGLMEIGRFKTMAEIAEAEGLDKGQVSRMMRLTLLAPDLVERMLGETLPRRWSLDFLMRRSIPKDWDEQRAMMPREVRH
ncbi:Bacteriophage-related protein [Gammaproteobacteria bacterium]